MESEYKPKWILNHDDLTWESVLEASKTNPAIHAALMTKRREGWSRERALILMALVQHYQIQHLQTELTEALKWSVNRPQ